MRWIAANQLRTGVYFDGVEFSFSFIYGEIDNPQLTHDVSIPVEFVVRYYEGDLSTAVAEYEYKEYLLFKKKLVDKLARKVENDEQIVKENSIRRAMGKND